MSKFHVRQGDVLVLATDHIPDGTKPVKRDAGRIVLAYGEVTGHAHAIHDRHATLTALADSDTDINDRFLEIVGSPAQLRHEEHSTIELPPGTYITRRQREYAPEANLWVAD